jgi:hypothetical protein
MSYILNCTNPDCNKNTFAGNTIELLDKIGKNGLFVCSHCQSHAYINKEFKLIDEGTWKPLLKGAIKLGDTDDTYHPFVYLVSYGPEDPPTDLWFCYYKDMRKNGGTLKLGHGPGGPPVVSIKSFLYLARRLLCYGLINDSDLMGILEKLDT